MSINPIAVALGLRIAGIILIALVAGSGLALLIWL